MQYVQKNFGARFFRLWFAYNLLGKVFESKKGPLEYFEYGYFGPKFRFWSRFGPLDPFFHQSCPPNALIWCLAMLWAPIGTLIGVLGCKTGPLLPFWSTQFAKVGLKWAKFYVFLFYVFAVVSTAKIWCKIIYALRMRINMHVWIQNSLRWHKKGPKIDRFWSKYDPNSTFLGPVVPLNPCSYYSLYFIQKGRYMVGIYIHLGLWWPSTAVLLNFFLSPILT